MLTDINYSARANEAGLNVYFISEGDREYNIRLEKNIPANPSCTMTQSRFLNHGAMRCKLCPRSAIICITSFALSKKVTSRNE